MFNNIIGALENNDQSDALNALASEKVINRMQIEYRRKHVKRMTKGDCSPVTGILFIDLIDNLEKIADHLTNVAQGVRGGLMWEGIGDDRDAGLELNSMQDAAPQ